MRAYASLFRCATATAALSGLFAALPAQTFSANTGTVAPVIPTSPRSTSVSPGHHKFGEDGTIYGRVRDGVYSVDGLVAKVQLNYDVEAARYLYFFVPGVGTAVVSAVAPADAVSVQAKLHDNELSFTADTHRFNLTGVALVNNKGVQPALLYVRLDRAAWRLNRQAMMGYGILAEAPYQWPGALPPVEERANHVLPISLLPTVKPLAPTALAASSIPAGPAMLRSVAF
jgi:hypothetical protein